jgi:hypothetical protein
MSCTLSCPAAARLSRRVRTSLALHASHSHCHIWQARSLPLWRASRPRAACTLPLVNRAPTHAAEHRGLDGPPSGADLTVTDINSKLVDTPGIVNESPFEKGWMFKVCVVCRRADRAHDFTFVCGAGQAVQAQGRRFASGREGVPRARRRQQALIERVAC